MSHNSFGHLFRVTTFGESHGPAIGCVVDGCPPGIPLTEADIQPWLDRRKPGQSKYVTQRKEPDQVRILSGVFQDERMAEQLTTGTPIALVIENVDARSKDYSDIRDKFRPGHADYTYWAKYGMRDYRGGGRQSARETATRVAAGAIARKILDQMYGSGDDPRRADPDGHAHHRPRALGLGRGAPQSVQFARCRRRQSVGGLSRRPAQGGLVLRRDRSKSSPKAFPSGSARRSTASSTPTSRPR